MLCGDVFIFQAVGLLICQVDDSLDTRGDKYLPGATSKYVCFRASAQDIVQPVSEFFGVYL